VCHVSWKDQAFILIISFFISGNERILRLRKRFKETSFKVKITRESFSKETIKILLIPVIIDKYNYYIGAVDEFNYLTAQNAGLRHVERGGHQVLEYWLFRMVLVNYYLLALYSDVLEPREISFRS
jgi:hypothetical protein